MNFLKLTTWYHYRGEGFELHGAPVFVNPKLITNFSPRRMRRAGAGISEEKEPCTFIDFGGAEDTTVLVQETPEQILAMIEELKETFL